MLNFLRNYQYLIVFLQVPKSASLKNHHFSASSSFVFADDLIKPKKKKQTQPSKTPSAR